MSTTFASYLSGSARDAVEALIASVDAETATYECLETVNGNFVMSSNAKTTSLSFPELTKVGGYLYVYNNVKLTMLSFPKLTDVEGYLEIHYNVSLSRIELPNLESVEGDLVISSNSSLGTIQGRTKPVHDKREEGPDRKRDEQQALGLLPMAGRTSCFV